MLKFIEFILSLFKQPIKPIIKAEAPLVKKILITVDDWLTSSGKYPERVQHATPEVIENAKILLDAINAFLSDLDVDVSQLVISSGFRPVEVNKSVKGAAVKSGHVSGKAIDFEDKDGVLDNLIMNNPELLKKHNLWLEHPTKTIGWVHLDNTQRSKREFNIFYP